MLEAIGTIWLLIVILILAGIFIWGDV